jgi:hypothetical protein
MSESEQTTNFWKLIIEAMNDFSGTGTTASYRQSKPGMYKIIGI